MSDGTDRLSPGRRRNDYETLVCDENPPPRLENSYYNLKLDIHWIYLFYLDQNLIPRNISNLLEDFGAKEQD